MGWHAPVLHSHAPRALAELGADLNKPSDEGFTPVSVAVCGNKLDAVRVLVELGCSVTNAQAGDNNPPIFAAVYNGHVEVRTFVNSLRQTKSPLPSLLIPRWCGCSTSWVLTSRLWTATAQPRSSSRRPGVMTKQVSSGVWRWGEHSPMRIH